MPDSTAQQLYPFTSQDKQAIPLEVVRPVAMRRINLTELIVKSITLESQFVVGWVWASVDSYIKFGAPDLPSGNVEDIILRAMFIPSHTIVSLVFEAGPISIMGQADGFIMFNAIEQWASLLQSQQLQQG